MTERRSSAPRAQARGATGASAARAMLGNSHTEFTTAEMKRIVEAVWQHGRVMPDADPATWRQDACGAWMLREHFGHEASEFGWNIERVSEGEPGGAGLLRPFNCRNGYDVANGRPVCNVTADRSNIPAERSPAAPRNTAP